MAAKSNDKPKLRKRFFTFSFRSKRPDVKSSNSAGDIVEVTPSDGVKKRNSLPDIKKDAARRLEEKQFNAKIDEYLKKEKAAFDRYKQEPKVLILGSSDSGKSTLLKQMKILHGEGFTDEERQSEKRKIRAGILFAVITLLELCVEFENRELVEKYKLLNDVYERYLDGEECTPEEINFFKEAWAEPVIQDKYLNEKHQLPDSTTYFMEIIDQVYTPSYIPSDDDMLNLRTVTRSVSDSVFVINNKRLHVIDVSGLSHHRKTWIPYFDDVNCIIFIASLSSYDQTMIEEDGVNRMVDSIVLFQEMVNHKLLCQKPFILFLNKKDIFLRKIKTKHIIDYFPNYKGPKEDPSAGVKYFDSKFRDQNAVTKEIITHVTCCTDTKIMGVIVSSVVNSIMVNLLNNVGLAV